MEFAIETYKLTKSFANIRAVDNLDLRVRKNTIYGLVGPDGAGKTTTMRMLTSLLEPDSGRAQIGGLDIVEKSDEIKEHIGYMPQKFSLYGDLTVMENLDFYSEIYEIPKKASREKIKYLLEFSSLSEHSYKLADQLSGGMKQKLALSCNLIHTPKYLFLDEPTIGVDPVARRELWKILFDLRELGATIFVSTPYMDEAERCDEIALMNKGRIIIYDKPDNIINGFKKSIFCVYSNNNHLAKELALNLENVEDAYLLGEELHIITDNPDIKAELEDNFSIKDISASINLIKPNLEDVFVNIVKSQQ